MVNLSYISHLELLHRLVFKYTIHIILILDLRVCIELSLHLDLFSILSKHLCQSFHLVPPSILAQVVHLPVTLITSFQLAINFEMLDSIWHPLGYFELRPAL